MSKLNNDPIPVVLILHTFNIHIGHLKIYIYERGEYDLIHFTDNKSDIISKGNIDLRMIFKWLDFFLEEDMVDETYDIIDKNIDFQRMIFFDKYGVERFIEINRQTIEPLSVTNFIQSLADLMKSEYKYYVRTYKI